MQPGIVSQEGSLRICLSVESDSNEGILGGEAEM